MNCGCIDWVNLRAPKDDVQDVFLHFCVKHGLSQLVTEPTHDSKILDVLQASKPICICDVSVLPPFSNSDHKQVAFKILFVSVGSCDDGNVPAYKGRL